MQSLQIPDVKDFMGKLLGSELFDAFVVSEAALTTFTTFQIDGSFHKDYYSEDLQQEESCPTALTWKLLRPHIFELIRGKHVPLSLKLIFRLADYNVEKLLAQAGVSLHIRDVAGLFLNIHYIEGKISCTTGSSLRIFTLDRSLDQAWDDMVRKYLRQCQIPFLEQ